MTRDDIIRMALKCGASIKSDCEGNGAFCDGIDLIAFATLVAAAEREAIAEMISNCDQRATPKGIAAAIRARGK